KPCRPRVWGYEYSVHHLSQKGLLGLSPDGFEQLCCTRLSGDRSFGVFTHSNAGNAYHRRLFLQTSRVRNDHPGMSGLATTYRRRPTTFHDADLLESHHDSSSLLSMAAGANTKKAVWLG